MLALCWAEYTRKDLARKTLFNKTLESVTEGSGPVSNVSNPKDSSGDKVSRFTYSKFAGFVP